MAARKSRMEEDGSRGSGDEDMQEAEEAMRTDSEITGDVLADTLEL